MVDNVCIQTNFEFTQLNEDAAAGALHGRARLMTHADRQRANFRFLRTVPEP
jgi:hypothetical protein